MPSRRSRSRSLDLRRRSRRPALVLLAAAVLLGGCALQRARPTDPAPAQRQAELLQRSPDDAQWRAPLARLGVDTGVWPLQFWDLRSLRALALVAHPQMQLARAELASARADAAGLRRRAGLLGGLELTLERRVGGDSVASPWSFAVVVDSAEWAADAALGGDSLRRTGDAAAQALLDGAELQAAAAAWQVQRGVRDGWLRLVAARRRVEIDAERLAIERESAAAWQARLRLGSATSQQAAEARRREASAQGQLRSSNAAAEQALDALAAATGFVGARFAMLDIGAADADFSAAAPLAADAQALRPAALLNRIDVRAGISRYAAADAALRAELARQLPALVLKPGWAWDAGERRWSVGIGVRLPPTPGNRAAIELAAARRDVEAATFGVVQLRALAELEQARSSAAEAAAAAAQDRLAFAAAGDAVRRAARRVAGGQADRLELLDAQRERVATQVRLLDTLAEQAAAAAALEDAIQRPLDALAGGAGALADAAPQP